MNTIAAGNPYTHEEHERTSYNVPKGEATERSCRWCGQRPKTLFQYDRRPGHFCNKQCYHAYHDSRHEPRLRRPRNTLKEPNMPAHLLRLVIIRPDPTGRPNRPIHQPQTDYWSFSNAPLAEQEARRISAEESCVVVLQDSISHEYIYRAYCGLEI